jgi:hypothetical protein
MIAIVLIKLLIAHLIGDFLLQPNTWVAEKEKKKLKSIKFYWHILIHIALIFILFGSFSVWKMALSIGLLHGIIDACKLIYQRSKTKRLWFFVDQILHLLVITAVWAISSNVYFKIDLLVNNYLWLNILAVLLLSSPTGILIKVIIAKWIPSKASSSLEDAGKYIGVLERLLIYLFILTNHFEAVGFLLAAKSIFRFGDLKDASDIKLTEYVLIGTLLSFGIAIVVALTVLYIDLIPVLFA